MKNIAVFVLFCLPVISIFAQTGVDSIKTEKPAGGKLTVQGYVDVYFSYALSHPADATHPYFVSYTRDNEVNLNLAYLSLKFTSDRVRASFGPGFGTYMNANYSSERQTLQNLLEANIGVRLFKKRNIWLDAGVINSPYTNESAYSFDQPTYTRSLGSENVPYYLTGVKASIPLTDKWSLYLYLLNGWQVIQAQHDPLDFGSQLEFKPNDRWDINWNTYAGNEATDSHPNFKTRLFTDLYAIFTPSPKWSLTADAYAGWQELEDNNQKVTRNWWNLNATAKFNFNNLHSVTARVEAFHDPYEIMVTPITDAVGFKLFSASLGYNLAITDNVLFRAEVRYFGSPEEIYPLRDQTNTGRDCWFTLGLTARYP